MNIPENFDRWMFDYMEGNLSPTEAKALEQFLLQNPSFEVDADAWRNAAVEESPINYPHQASLERKNRFVGWYGWSAAVFLISLLGFGGYLTFNNTILNDSNVATNRVMKPLTIKTLTGNKTFNFGITTNTIEIENQELNRNQINTLSLSQNNRYVNNENKVSSNVLVSNNHLNRFNRQEIKNNQNESRLLTQPRIMLQNNEYAELGNNNQKEKLGLNRITKKERKAVLQNNNKALAQTKAQYESDEHVAEYNDNPKKSNKEMDLSKVNNVKINSFSSKLNRLYSRIEKMLGYPVGLVNLRDPEFILPENSILSFNPGFTGGMLAPRFETKYRNQWTGSGGNSQISQFSFDNYIQGIRGGFGFTLNSAIYENGAFADHSIDLMYSPKIVINKNVVFEPGVKATIGILSGNQEKFGEIKDVEMERGLLMKNTFEQSTNFTEKLWYKDIGVGAVLNTKWFYVGVSADNLSRHYANTFRLEGDVAPIRSPILYNGIVGADYESSNKNMGFSPFISVRKFGNEQEAWGGMNFRINNFIVGGAYSTKKDYTFGVGMKFKSFKLVYQYDQTKSLLLDSQSGSHSISMRFNGGSKKTRLK